jgi:hypothetical protein
VLEGGRGRAGAVRRGMAEQGAALHCTLEPVKHDAKRIQFPCHTVSPAQGLSLELETEHAAPRCLCAQLRQEPR